MEQTLFDAYMAENKNVTIEVETLDDEAYKTKFKAYASGSQMPGLAHIRELALYQDAGGPPVGTCAQERRGAVSAQRQR